MHQLLRLTILVLLVVAGSAQAQDDSLPPDAPLILHGQVTDTDGTPLEGYVVEIWQTDINGVYDHPGDSVPDDLVEFQYFGTATTDENGFYMFVTVLPGEYEPRPAHIHWKVKFEDETLLTSQFYFTDETDFRTDETVTLTLEQIMDDDEEALWQVVGNIVLDLNGSTRDTLEPTLRQPEGPFYPVVDFAEYDNNLLNAETDEEPVTFCDDEALSELVYGDFAETNCDD